MEAHKAIHVAATPREVFDTVSDIREWPRLLPHYRYVRVLSETDDVRIARMGARRGIIPVSWAAAHRIYPAEPRMTFHHVGGVTKGMAVEWSFAPAPGGTTVAIHHELTLGWPLIGRLVADRIIGPFFVQPIAGRTLRCFKQIVEGRVRPSASSPMEQAG